MLTNPAYFSNFLRLTGVLIVLAGCMHVVLGLNADLLLGAGVSESTRVDAGLDSQNRFYGACFTLFGAVSLIAASDLTRYRTIVRAAFTVFLFAGLVRFISVWKFGWPPPLMSVLFALEVALPPVALLWLSRLDLADC